MQKDESKFTCHECGYDMHDREKDDPCPECNTPLDIRPDFPGSKRVALVNIWILIISLLIMPFASLFSFFGLVTVIFPNPNYSRKLYGSKYRISFCLAKRCKLIQRLIRVWFVEFVALMAISTIWPNALNWW